MASLDQAVGHNDQVNKSDADCREVQESLHRSRDGQALAKRGLCRILAIVRSNSLANQAPTGRRQGDMRSTVGWRSGPPQLGRRVVADVGAARHQSDDGRRPQERSNGYLTCDIGIPADLVEAPAE
jgi:hypothetical protein